MKYYLLVLLLHIPIFLHPGRSVFRTKDPNIPTLKVSWEKSSEYYLLQDSHLEKWSLFHTFDKVYFDKHMLPQKEISYRYTQETVQGCLLGNLVQTAVDELRENKKKFSHFTILKKRDFRDGTGLIILKFKDYPFVVKLFIETPESFVVPCNKGFESTCFFYMGGGMNRHLVGFSRIKNLEYLQAKLVENPCLAKKIDFPRKWFWLSSGDAWLILEGKNIGTQTLKTKIPSVYAIVEDYINVKRSFTLQKRQDRRIAFALSSYFKSAIDSHINNYAVEEKTEKIVILDTEHFPTLVGLRREPPSKSYLQWYTHLAAKMVHDVFWRTKYERYSIQKGEHPLLHTTSSINV